MAGKKYLSCFDSGTEKTISLKERADADNSAINKARGQAVKIRQQMQ